VLVTAPWSFRDSFMNETASRASAAVIAPPGRRMQGEAEQDQQQAAAGQQSGAQPQHQRFLAAMRHPHFRRRDLRDGLR
jgi:hypothetical protein